LTSSVTWNLSSSALNGDARHAVTLWNVTTTTGRQVVRLVVPTRHLEYALRKGNR
jgi:hypothetical protein